MLAKVISGTTLGLDGLLVEVEVDVATKGFPKFNIVGLPSKSVDESKERVRAAIVNAGYEMPDTRITVNLAPADLPKEGAGFDLPIAIGILAAAGMIKKESLEDSIFLGELSLQGGLRKVPGIISITIEAEKKKIEKIYLPNQNIIEASLINNIETFAVKDLSDLIFHLNGDKILNCHSKKDIYSLIKEENFQYYFEDVKGQESVKRGLEIAASGFHNVIMKGPPGTGKTLLSRAFPSILPQMEKSEILEVTKIYSVVGLLNNEFFKTARPFRSPHHTTSRIGLIGGGSTPTPGEISLAHRGVLFLDELPEFPRSVLEALRQPLEDGKVTISRASGSLTFPSRFLLLAACNPCPCGYLGHPKKTCRCFPGSILKYKKRLSGPLMDRIDIHLDVAPVDEEKLTNNITPENSKIIRERIIKTRKIQKIRFSKEKILTNGEMGSSEIKKYCKLDDKALGLLKQAISRLSLSARSYHKTIKIGQTISDMKNENIISIESIAEALQYRSYDD
ncbi:MAG: hypothetical protein UR68_C0005G0012 [Candidatus Roizmanbacteria bacterium GW2011_GWA2_35_19]|uniref:AAA+ ATPase domain-containing protein n=2 Tax=Candidatus Roizmaniibacteriota TaxID=1752723 RepID=A0A0G0BVH3_9BACT|nr:MAG: hypothetical protein UR63_C0028G0012 [Candidatus Roizmanbacteria bacterium GW2011_GWC2_35_12]KKP73278.1 MAG: hypothetical protein UR68_C0005G0012 [Candidatus Roizmanbacteria bacterium GW2011_GWA2_35_19]